MGGDYTGHAMKKEEAHKLVERMPANATWDDLRYEIDARVAIERGLADSQAVRICSVKEVREKYGLPERMADDRVAAST